jgi:YidC/Oxa1 family membrane protein insertase
MFHTLLIQPLYNGLIFLMDILPWFDVGVIIILFTVLVKLVLFPLSKKATLMQIEMKEMEPELKKIKEAYKNDRTLQAQKTMEVYRNRGVSPFSSILVILIQIPIIFALYFVFLKSGLPDINEGWLYSFINPPHVVDMNFLGLINITGKSLILALLAGISSYIQIRAVTPAIKPSGSGEERTFKDDLARSMNLQMRYVFPVIAFLVSYQISGVIALYWFTSNVFAIVQDKMLRKHKKNTAPTVQTT